MQYVRHQHRASLNAVGKLSGAVGAYNKNDSLTEELVCAELGLGFEPIANQVVQRDRHAAFLVGPGHRRLIDREVHG